jgi:steroid delta-isomerase-like uncharacterized protein
MSTHRSEESRNEETARRLFDAVFSRGELDAVDEIMAPGSVGHAPPDVLEGPDGVRAFVSSIRSAFPDLEFDVRDLIAEGETVVVRWVARGTHEGEFQGIPPTGETIEMTGITIERFEDGRIVEGWTNRDALGMLQQLGVVPAPGSEPGARP